MYDLIEAKHIDAYTLELVFENGKKGTYDFSTYIKRGGVFIRFSDLSYFKRFYINKELGVLCWPDGLDVAPETVYHAVTGEPLPSWMVEEKQKLVAR